MARSTELVTHEGGRAAAVSDSDALLRTTASCMLFENTFYESGSSVAARLAELVRKNSPERVAEVASLARNELKLRSVPLWLAAQMAIAHKGSPLVRQTVRTVVQRPDQIGETIALYWKAKGDERKETGKTRLPFALRRGLADSFGTFNEYQLAKWDRKDRVVKLKDALFLTHPRAATPEQDALWKRLVDGTMQIPDTWEVAYSAATSKEEKAAIWTRLVSERKLGAVATIMNLRNMVESGVETAVIRQAITNIGPRSRLLPFRFVAASKIVPQFSEELGAAMLRSLEGFGRLPGKTALAIDISGSMQAALSERGTTSRAEAAAALGALLREVCDEVRVYVFGTDVKEVSNSRGMALVNEVRSANERGIVGHGTDIKRAVDAMSLTNPARIMLVTDMQGQTVPTPGWRGYIINCAPYGQSLEAPEGQVQLISGLSDRILDWVSFEETGRLLSSGGASEAEVESEAAS